MKSKVVVNTSMLYIVSITKMIFPLVTLPYLTRVLSEDMYGFVSYVKSCMIYMQLIVDFGFILSSVKDIVRANGDKNRIGHIVGNTIGAKFFLALISSSVLYVMWRFIAILQMNTEFLIFSFCAVVTTILFADFLFRGIEKMHYITFIYLISKGISVGLTFLLVKGDSSIMWIPVLDILTNIISVVITGVIVRKLEIKVRFSGVKECWRMIKDSFVYFLSSAATTAFSALNTLLIGIFITDLTEIAHWSLCLSIVCTIQGLYTPICNGIYPHMIKEKNLKFIHRVLVIFMPIVIGGCILSFFMAKVALFIVGGEKYVEAYSLFRWMIPILFFSFPAQVYGWPTLGAVGKVKETTATTVLAASVQVLGLVIFILFDMFSTTMLAILRFITEGILLIARMWVTYRNRKCFFSEENDVSRC